MHSVALSTEELGHRNFFNGLLNRAVPMIALQLSSFVFEESIVLQFNKVLDIYESVAGYLNSELSSEPGVSETITKLTDEGKLGLKTGGGLFQYSEEELAELPARRAAALVAVRKTLDGQDV